MDRAMASQAHKAGRTAIDAHGTDPFRLKRLNAENPTGRSAGHLEKFVTGSIWRDRATLTGAHRNLTPPAKSHGSH